MQDCVAVLVEADGSANEARRGRDALIEALTEGALLVSAPECPQLISELWRWRDGVSIAVTASRGGKVSEDIVVPLKHLEEAINATSTIGRNHDLEALSWGHAGDGNLHSTFLLDPADKAATGRAEAAAQDLFRLAVTLGGSISGEHGVGLAKNRQLRQQWVPQAVRLHNSIKTAFDPRTSSIPARSFPDSDRRSSGTGLRR